LPVGFRTVNVGAVAALSLVQLLARHRCILVLDAASGQVQVGVLTENGGAFWEKSTDESGKALFTLSDDCLKRAGVSFAAIEAFAFCAGPGSMLGIRTAAMAIRTWQAATTKPLPAYRYYSLPLVALELKRTGTLQPFAVIADARRDSWHHVSVDTSRVAALRRVESAALAAGNETLYQPAGFRAWTNPPRGVRETRYDVGQLFAAHREAPFLESTDAPDAFQYEAPEYKKWTAQVHRRPAD
jgi:tRNA threonylcarbamoyladenosine biosynthesis protein TsaB